MKFSLSILLLLVTLAAFSQQKETFDVTSFTPPAGWKKEAKENVISYSIVDNARKTWAQIGIFKSTIGKGGIQQDFESEWQDLVVKTYKPLSNPEMIPTASENGWDAKGGAAPFEFNGSKSAAMLVTMSGSGRCTSILILTNTQDYQSQIDKFLESVSMKKIEVPAETKSVAVDNASTSILGTWGKAYSVQAKYNDAAATSNAGYSKEQYTFLADGTYSYVSKIFRMSMSTILLGKESGVYQINANTLTITPKDGVNEEWTKKDGVDKYGQLKSKQNRNLEKVTYQYTRHYFSGIQQWNLVLQGDKATQRDGSFSSNTTFSNAWYYSPISVNNPEIELPASATLVETKAPAKTSDFSFSTTNFDDGWVATEQTDWVQVTKGNIKVLIHYPNKSADEYNSVLMDGLKNAWNVLVAPRYSSASNFEFKPITSWESIEFAEADMVEKTSGKTVHVVLFKKNYTGGNGKYLEFITPDKASFETEFGAYHQDTYGWEKVENMSTYNKFAVSAGDLNGKWTTNFSGMTQYVNAYTGADAGATSHASSQSFQFSGDTYHWELAVASGVVGNLKFENVKSNGKFSMPSNWQIKFSDLEGKPKTYDAYFSCIKGARMLWLSDTSYPGYTGFGKAD